MQLQDIPEEILLKIIDTVADEGIHYLHSIALTCKRCNVLCNIDERRSYHCIFIHSFLDCNIAFRKLLAILRKPRLGRYVRHLEVNMQPRLNVPFVNLPPVWERNLPDEDIRLLRAAVRNAGFGGRHEQKVMQMLMQRNPYNHFMTPAYSLDTARERGVYIGQAIAAILLTVCIDIENMAVGTPAASELTWDRPSRDGMLVHAFPLCRILKAIYESPLQCRYLSKLRVVELFTPRPGSKMYDQTDIIGRMEIFQGLPSLETIVVEGASWRSRDTTESVEARFTVGTCRAKNVYITHSKFGTDVLAGVLSAVSELREFTYCTGGRLGHAHFHDANDYNPCTFFKFLLIHRRTLRTLDLDCDAQLEESMNTYYDGGETVLEHYPNELNLTCGPYYRHKELRWIFALDGGLRDFSALTHLKIGAKSLVLFALGINTRLSQARPYLDGFMLLHALPPNLQVLTVRGFRVPIPGAYYSVDWALLRLGGLLARHRPDLVVEGLGPLVHSGYDVTRRPLPADVYDQVIGP
ncbi:hypothetical protein BDW72DRAFT_209916 [Aspergillus terricola var. indicus]